MDSKQDLVHPKKILISYLESYSIAFQLKEAFELLGIKTELFIIFKIIFQRIRNIFQQQFKSFIF